MSRLRKSTASNLSLGKSSKIWNKLNKNSLNNLPTLYGFCQMLSLIRAKSLVPGCLLLLLLSGCSISYSGGKSSDSVSAGLDSASGSLDSLSSISISTSSGDSAAELANAVRLYMEDVSALTRLYIFECGTRLGFQRDLAGLAEGYGIMDWEAEPTTYRAIGIGLRRGEVTAEDIENMTFLPPAPAEFSHLLQDDGYRG